MSQLPIETVLPSLLSSFGDYQQIILKAAPGAGKSTVFPLSLLLEGNIKGKILMLEPRRLAARNIATFMAKQLNESVGQRIGYRVRGETKVSAQTQLEIVTEGILTRMIQNDPELAGIDVIIFDEFHERSLHTDTALAFALEVQGSLRDDMTVVIMSATLDENDLKPLLPDAVYIESEGRQFPIEYRYSPISRNQYFINEVTKTIVSLLMNESGSMLVFLPGVGPINQVMSELQNAELNEDVLIYPLYGQLDFAAQQAAIQPAKSHQRKVVLATNIAETSLTIEGIRLVVDSGLEKIARFDANLGITKLEQVRISQSSASQRAGRAGRLEPGICVRLYSESELQQQPQLPEPEILRSDLTPLSLELSQWGVTDCNELVWLDLPPSAHLEQAHALLLSLELIDQKGQLTSLGRKAYSLSVAPRLASMLVKAEEKGKAWLNAAIASAVIIEDPDPRYDDVAINLHLWQTRKHSKSKWLTQKSRQLALKFNARFELEKVDPELMGPLLALAFPDRIAQQRGKGQKEYLLSNRHGAQIKEESNLFSSEYVVVADLMKYSSMNSQVLLASELNMTLLKTEFPTFFDEQEVVLWDEKLDKLVAENQLLCGKLIIDRSKIEFPDKQKLTQALLKHVQYKGLSALNWGATEVEWLERVRCAIEWMPEQDWPAMDEQSLLDNTEQWLMPYLENVTSAKGLAKIPLLDALKAYLGWPLNQKVDEWVPIYYRLPTGTKKKIRYQQGMEPILSVRIQEVFGEKTSPCIAQGKKKVVMELLSPAQRPIQITQDLSAFWAGSYQEVKKEMKGRYPKHVWPDDPANHIATTKTKRQLDS